MSDGAVRTILLIDDPGYAGLLREGFNASGILNVALTQVSRLSDAERHLSAHSVDLILFDPGAVEAQGFAAIRRFRALAPRVPVVVLTVRDDGALVVEQALREGAQGYYVKDQITMRGLLRSLSFAIERKRLDDLKDEYIATVSHELRAPLTSIAGSLGLLIGHWGGHLPDAAARLVAIAQTSSQRLVRLVDDILDIERIESARGLALTSIDIDRVLQQAIDGSRGLAERYGVRMVLDIGPLRGDVNADPDRLVQVVINLLANAIKASPTDADVVVVAQMHEGLVRICVRDHGAGVPAGFRPYIFERFAQGPACSRQGGSGLGLSIVKTIVERMGGGVGFHDAPGSGTVFYVDLPVLDDPGRGPASGREHNLRLGHRA